MIDSHLRQSFQKTFVNPVVNQIVKTKINPNSLTALALGSGVSIIPCLAFGFWLPAIILLLFSGYMDVLDGSLARAQDHATPGGTVFDIVSDRIVEFSIIFALYLIDPTERATACIFMLGSILVCVTSFLVVGIFIENSGKKSFHYSPGIMERSEAFIFFGLMILFPSLFLILSTIFTMLVALTGILRVRDFVGKSCN